MYIYTLLNAEQVPLIDPVRLEPTYGSVQLQPELLDNASQGDANAIAGTTSLTYYGLYVDVWQNNPEHSRYVQYLSALPTIEDPVIWEPPID